MKNVLLILSIIAVMMGVSSCENENVKRLRRDVETADKECPVNMGMLGDMLNIKYDEDAKEVRMYFSINEEMVSIDGLKENEQISHQLMKLSFSKGDSRELMKLMIDAGAGLSVIYKSVSTGKSFKLKLPLDELKEIMDSSITDEEINKMILDSQLSLENARCPYFVAEGMEMVKVYDDGDNIVYACQMDEEMYDLSAMKYGYDEIKRNIRELFKDDPSMKKQLGMIKSLNKGIIYHYYGDKSGESADIVFSNDEL